MKKGAQWIVCGLGLIALCALFFGLSIGGALMLYIPSYGAPETPYEFKVTIALVPLLWIKPALAMFRRDYRTWNLRAGVVFGLCIIVDLVAGGPFIATVTTLVALTIQRIILATDPTEAKPDQRSSA